MRRLKTRRLIRVCLFAKINTLLVMVDYKIVYDQALIHFALIGDKSSKGAYEEAIPTSSQILRTIFIHIRSRIQNLPICLVQCVFFFV